MALKVIIAGAGKAGSDLHLNGYRQIADVEVIALCDLDVDRARSVASERGVPHAYRSLDEALAAHPAEIVSICTPPSSHFALCRLALKQGCDVLVEKPIFQTLDEARQIQGIIAQTGRRISAVHNQKYARGIQEAMKLVREKYIGDVVQVHAVWMVNGSRNRMTADPDFWCHTLPGGRWEEMIAHPIYKAYQFMGPMQLAHLEMKQVHNRWPWLPADELEIVLEGASGYVDIKLSANTEKYNYMLVYGSKRVLYVDGSMATDLLSAVRPLPSSDPFIYRWTKKLLHGVRRRLAPLEPAGDAKTAHARLIADFVAHIKGERDDPPVSWQEAFNTLELVLQIGKEIERRK